MNSISLLDQPLSGVASVGKVFLVGAGSGEPSLLSAKGKVLLEYADIVIYDALVSLPILDLINPRAEQINVDKQHGRRTLTQAELTRLLIEKARSHAVVVRLTSDNPFNFEQSSEAMKYLAKSGISVEVVPGTPTEVTAPACVGSSSIWRQPSSSIAFVPGYEPIGRYRPQVNWQALAHGSETIVIYMGMHTLSHIVGELMSAGLQANTPIALVRWDTHPDQETLFGTLETIVDRAILSGFEAPAIVVIGQVVNLHTVLDQVHAATCV